MEAVDENVADTGSGGDKHGGLWHVVKCCVPSHTDIWVRGMGPDATYGTDPWDIPPQGVSLTDRAKSAATI